MAYSKRVFAVIREGDPRFSGNTMGATIRRLRVEKGLTQSALGKAVGVSPVAVSGWESGRCRPKIGNLEILAAALGTTLGKLVSSSNREQGYHALSNCEGPFVQIRHSRDEIAQAMGISPDRVRITLEI